MPRFILNSEENEIPVCLSLVKNDGIILLMAQKSGLNQCLLIFHTDGSVTGVKYVDKSLGINVDGDGKVIVE